MSPEVIAWSDKLATVVDRTKLTVSATVDILGISRTKNWSILTELFDKVDQFFFGGGRRWNLHEIFGVRKLESLGYRLLLFV